MGKPDPKKDREALQKRQIEQEKNRLQREQNEAAGARRRVGQPGRIRRKR